MTVKAKGKYDLDAHDLEELDAHVGEIRAQAKRTVEYIVNIGRRLIKCKALTKGHFVTFLEAEFGWTVKTAERYMTAAEVADQFDKLSKTEVLDDFPVSALYLLGDHKVPKPVVESIIEGAKRGERQSVKSVKAAIATATGRAPKVSSKTTPKVTPAPTEVKPVEKAPGETAPRVEQRVQDIAKKAGAERSSAPEARPQPETDAPAPQPDDGPFEHIGDWNITISHPDAEAVGRLQGAVDDFLERAKGDAEKFAERFPTVWTAVQALEAWRGR
jgi:hypothetical protein